MKSTAKKLVSLLLAVIMVFGTAPISVFATDAEQAQSKAENSTNWDLDYETGVLTVWGSGDMENLINPSDYPWYIYKNEIEEVVVEDGVTSVGASAFGGYAITSVTLAPTVEYIGDGAFADCSALAEINVDESFTGFGKGAFTGTAHYADPANHKNGAYYINNTLVNAETDGVEYTIPSGTLAVADFAVVSSSIINVNIPADVKYIGSRAFADASALKTITVDENNGYFSSDAGGALYSKDKTKLICVPSSSESMAKFYNVNYYVNGQLVHSESVEEYKAIPEYTYDPGEGKTFLGWSEIPETMPEKDVDVYGSYEINKHTVTFRIDGVVYAEAELAYGTAIVDPEYTPPAGHSFSGWDIPETMPDHDLVIDATLSVNTYNAIFYLDDAQTDIHATVPTVFGKEIKFPANPHKDGFVFLGWDDDSTVMDAEGKTYVALWAEKEYSLTFYDFNGVFTTIYAYLGQVINEEDVAEPTFPGYIFTGWADSYGNPVSFPITVTDSMEFTATFVAGESEYSIDTYIMNTEGEYELSSSATYSATTDSYVIYEPETKEGFSIDPSLSKLEDYITSDGIIRLYVYYSRNKYNVTVNGEKNQYYYGETISLPDVEQEGYVFDGWMDENGEEISSPFTVPAHDTVLNPCFVSKMFTVTFMVDGKVHEKITCNYGSKINAPDAPEKEGYSFKGWMNDGLIVSFPFTVMSDGMVFDACYIANPMTDYSVEIYLMDTEGEYSSTPDRCKMETAAVGTTVTADHSDYIQDEWFFADKNAANVTSGKVADDGSTTLKLYYARVKYPVTVDGVMVAEVRHGATFTAPSVSSSTPIGYELVSWNNGTYAIGERITVYEPLDLFADIEASEAVYRTELYYMGTDGNYGEPFVQTETAQIGTFILKTHGDYPCEDWFFADETAENVTSAAVSADGSTTLKLYYARTKYPVTVDGTKADEIYHGATFTAPSVSSTTPVGYALRSWNNGSYSIGQNITVIAPLTLVADNVPAANSVAISAYYVDAKLGGTVELDAYTVETKTGYTVKVVNFLPEEPEENVTYVLKSELPAAEHYEIDPDAEYSVAVSADGTAILKIEYVSKTYNVKFLDIKGNELYSKEHKYYDTVNAPAAPDLSSEGKLFMEWVVKSGIGNRIDEYDSFVVEGSVTYQAAYYSEEYYVFYASEETDGWDAPTLDNLGLPEEDSGIFGETIVLPDLTDKVIGYEFLGYEVIGAEYDESTRTVKIGTENVDIIARWDRIEYTITYVVMNKETVIEYYFGDVVEIPPDPVVANCTFIGWDTEIPAVMPSQNLVITALFDRTPIMLIPKNDSCTTVIDRGGETTEDYVEDESEWCIYGLREYLNEEVLLENYIDVQGDGSIDIIPVSEGCYGTGTVVNVRDNITNEIVESFRIVVFGDLNGDSVVQAVDYSIVEDAILGLTNWANRRSGIYYMIKAADLDCNLRVNIYDASLIEYVCLGLYAVDQVMGMTTDIFPETPDDYSAEPIYSSSETAAIRTEIHALSDDGEWVKTDKVKAGEAVKARVFIDTDYYTNAGSLMFFYNSDFFTDSYTYSQPAELTANPYGSAYDNGVYGEFAKLEKTNPMVENLISDGYLTENFVNEHEIITAVYSFSPSTSKIFSGDQWIMEFDLTVKDDATGFGNFFVVENTVKNADNGVYAYINLPVGAEDSEQSKTTSLHLCDVAFKAESSPVEISKTVEITFDAGLGTFADGASTYTVEATVGEAMPEIPVPELEGHYFVSWSCDPSIITGLPEVCPDADTVCYAIFESALFTVKHLVYWEDGSFFKTAYEGNLEYGKTVPLVPSAFKVPDGYALSPAYTSDDFNELYPEGTVMPAEDITVYYMLVALDYVAVFDANGGTWADGESKKSVTATFDSQITTPENPVREGYVFIGWSPDVGIMDENGKTFTATWEAETYTATYLVDGEIYDEFPLEYGAETEYPADPHKEGYVFVGWTPSIPATMPAEDLEFNAVFEVNLYEIIFRIDGTVNTEKYIYGDAIYEPYPTKIGHRFVGWDNPIPATMPAEDLVFTAQFEPLPFDAVFDANGGEWYDGDDIKVVENVTFGSEIIAPDDPVREGYIFAGWSEYGTDNGVGIMDAEGKTFYAVWNTDLSYCRIQNVFCATNGVYAPQKAIYVIKSFGSVSSIQFVNREDENSSVTFDKPEIESDCVSDDLSKIGVVSVEAYNHDDLQIVLGSDETAYEIWTVVAELDEGDYKVRANINGTEEGWESTDFAYDYRVEFEPKTVELILDANGGSFSDGSSNKFITALYGESIEGIYEEPSYDGYVFTGWLDENGNEVVFNGTMPDAEGMLFAQWAEVVTGTFENLEYSFNKTSGELVISGEGDIPNCDNAPWDEFDVKSVIISEGVTSIGDFAFDYCENLTSVTIPDSVTSIGDFAFDCCENLTSVTIGNSVTSIGFGAFEHCENLTNITIPDSVTTIGNSAFRACFSLTTITIPDSVTSIGDFAFDCCENLTSVTIGNSVTSIGDYAFRDCFDLSSVTIGNSVTSIGESAFNGCSITDVYYAGTEEQWKNITIDEYNEALTSATIHYESGTVETASTFSLRSFFGLSRKADADVVFKVPETVTEIADYAFMYSKATRVKIPASVAVISETAFAEAAALEYVEVNGDNEAFTDKNGVLFTKNGDVIVAYPRAKDDSGYTLPIGTKAIGAYAFNGSVLEKIYLPSSLETIGDYAFCNSYLLTYADIENNVTDIGEFAFFGCPLESADIPSDLVSLGNYAFFGSCLEKIEISESVNNIGEFAFAGNFFLEKITVDKNNAYYESDGNGVLYTKGMAMLIQYPTANVQTAFVIPETVGEIADMAFYANESLGEIVFCDHLAIIGDRAFEGCSSISSIILPESIERMGDDVFSGCSSVLRMKIDAKFADSVDFREMTTLMDLQFTGDTSSIVIPAKIDRFEAVGSYDDIALSWSKSFEAKSSSYRIFRKGADDGEFSLLKTVDSRTTLTYTDTTALEDTVYKYVIVTVNETTGIISPMSAEATCAKAEDTVPPVVTKITPDTLSFISGTENYVVYADDDLMMSGVSLHYSTDNGVSWTLIGTDNSKPYNFSFDTTAVTDGVIRIRALAYDAAGNESEPMIFTYTVDNTGPEKIKGLRVEEAYATFITVAWDDVEKGDAASFTLQMKNSDGSYKTVASSISELGYKVTNLAPDTAYTFRVAATDEQGNLGEYSDDFTASTVSDTTAPDTKNLKPSSGRHNKDISFSATATDDYAIKSIEIQVSTDKITWETVDSAVYTDFAKSKTYACSIPISGYNDGIIYVRALATDYSGNNNVDDGSFDMVEYFIDTTAPASPEGLVAAGGDGWIYLRWNVGSEDDLSSYSVYRSTSKDGNYALIANYLNTYDYYDTTAVRNTVYYYKIRVIDSLGNISDFSQAVPAKVADDVTPPRIISISPATGKEVSPIYKTVSVYSSDNASLETIRLEYKINGAEEYTLLESFSVKGKSSVTVKTDLPTAVMASGDRITLRVVVTDITGLAAEQTVEYLYVVDTEAPVISDLGVVVDGDYCKITWKDAADTDAAGYKIYRINSDGSFIYIGSRAFSSKHSYTFYDKVSELGTGDYAYKVDAYDPSGNTNSYFTDSVHYEYVPEEEPDVPETPDEPDNPDNPDEPDQPVNAAPNIRITAYSVLEVGVEEYFDAGGSFDDSQIVSFLWDFGDGTTSDEVKAAKKYEATGTYEVKLTVTDDGGLSTSHSFSVTVHEREALGTVRVTVVDSNGRPKADAPVYFDANGENETVVVTDKNGVASLKMKGGTYNVAVFYEDYVPDIKQVTVLPNAERRITLCFIEQKVVEGEFEVIRLTHAEVENAGIDMSDSDNYDYYKTVVHVQYGGSTIPIFYIRNDKEIIGSSVGSDQKVVIGNNSGYVEPEDPKPSPGPDPSPDPFPDPFPDPTPVPDGTVIIKTEGGHREITPIFIPNEGNKELLMMLDMPVGARSLKECFAVNLHLLNNAYPQFTLLDNEIVLDIPNALSINTTAKGFSNSKRVTLDTIENGATISWFIQGNEEGNHMITADFNGRLSMFNNAPVTASFSTGIRVYGMSDIKINVEVNDEIRFNAFYFNIGLVNDGTVDKLNLNLDYDGIVRNISASTLQRMAQEESGEEGEIDTSGDFEVPATLMNVRYVYADGTYSYIPYTVCDGHVITGINTVAPGEAIYYEYVAYNAINYDGVAVFEKAAVEELGKYSSNVTVTPISMNLYDKLNVVDRLTEYGSIDKKALNYLITDGNYYYWNQATGTAENSIGRAIYNCSDAVFEERVLNHREKSILAEKVILHHFTSNDIIENIGDLVEEKYVYVIQKLLADLKAGLVADDFEENADIQAVSAWLDSAQKDYELIATLGAELRMKGAEGLKGSLISSLCIAAQAQLVKYDSFAFLNDDYIVRAFAELCNYSKELLDPAILGPVKNVSQEYLNQYIYNAVQSSACVEEELFIMDMFRKYADRSFLDSDYKGLVNVIAEKYISIVESRSLNLVSDIRTEIIALEKIEDTVTEKLMLEVILNPISSRTNNIYTLLGISYDEVVDVLSIGREYRTRSIVTLAECISTVFLNAWIDHDAEYEYNGQSLSAAVDASHLLMYLTQSRLVGESLFKEYANNFETEFLRSLNSELHTNYESTEAVYDDVYKNILEARDTIFNIEETQAAEKPEAPAVTLNYDTLTTNEKFDDTYEYCYSDGEWKRCDGNEIPFKLKGHTTVLRVRKASAEGKLSGEITTVNIWGQRELRKNISVRYDNGYYYFTNLSSLYRYQICPLEYQYDEPDWNNSVTLTGGYNACAAAPYGKYLAIRSCENEDKNEIASKVSVLDVNTKQLLTVSVWGSGTVTQSAENGRYFAGEDAYLTATPSNSIFEGWYIDGVKVSGDKNYILEMYDFAHIVAKFVGENDVAAESANLSILTDNEVYSLSSGQVVPMIYAGAKGRLIAEILPENTTDKSVEWKSSDSNVAVINADGIISFRRSGTVTVTATLSSGVTVSAKIKVLANGVEECYVASMPDKTTYYEDESLELDGLVLMAKYTNGTVREVTDYTVAGFDNSVGEKTVVLTYMGANAELKVKVIHNCSYTVSKEATCTEEGVKIRYCVLCGMTVETVSIPVTEHTCEWVITKEATVDEKGVKEFICTVCGTSTATDSVDWCDHEFSSVNVPAECGKEGYTVHTCNKCGYEKKDSYTEALTHSYTETVISPTCTSNGCTVYICRLCSDKYVTDRIQAIGHSYVEETVAPSCAAEGYTLHSCENCGDSYKTNLVKKLPHSYSAVVTEPTCSVKGYTTHTCSVCSNSYVSDEVDTIAHELEYTKVFDDCTKGGYTLNTCKNCDYSSKTDVIAPAEHKYGDWIIKKPSSESASGLKYRQCTVCSKEETQVIPIVDHEHIAGEWVDETTADCDSYGTQARRCQKCGEIVESRQIPALGHKYSSEETAPSCTDDGFTTHTCSVCGHTYTDSRVPSSGHSDGDWEETVKADCYNEGKREKHCTVCGELTAQETVPALNHSSWTWNVVSEADCSVSGLRIKICDYCGKELGEETTPAQGHDYSAKVTEKTCTDDGFTTFTCNTCGDSYVGARVEATGHVAGDWEVSVAPTVETEGKREKRCTVCSELLDTAVIPTLKEPVSGITLNASELELLVEDKAELVATVSPANAIDKSVIWTSDKPDVVHVDENGAITALRAGVAVITASAAKGEFTASCTVTVKKNMYKVSWIIDGEKITETIKVGTVLGKPADPEKKGYSFAGWTPDIPDTMPANDVEFTAVWSVNSYEAVFDANGGRWLDGDTAKTVKADYDSQISAPENPVREGYSFGGWDKTVGIMNSVDGKTFKAVWLSSNEALYTVETYLMNTEGDYEKSTQLLGGIGGSTVSLNPEPEAGLALNTEKSVLSGTVTADNALVLKVYIDRKIYTFSTVVDGVTASEDYYYGAILPEISDPVKEGYVFGGWNKPIPKTMPAENLTVEATFDKLGAKVEIVNNPGTATIKHGETLNLTATATGMPEGAYLAWFVDGAESGTGETYSLTVSEGSVTVEVKAVDKDGKILTDENGAEISDSQKVTVNSSIWQRIVSFFKNLFRMNRTVIQYIFKA